jgi:hypothetical protein
LAVLQADPTVVAWTSCETKKEKKRKIAKMRNADSHNFAGAADSVDHSL